MDGGLPVQLPLTIRAPAAGELPALRQIEAAAARRFRGTRYPEIAQSPPTDLEVLQGLAADEGILVAADAAGRPLGFALYMPLDGLLYLAELNVRPEAAGRRIGARLIEAVAEVARARGCPALTLTTFRDIAWNAPYYARLGFCEIAAAELPPGLAEELRRQAARGLKPASRCAMRRAVA
jgi:predicted N-acetyltransferase YhbS